MNVIRPTSKGSIAQQLIKGKCLCDMEKNTTMKINEHVATLESSYLFSRIRQKVKEYKTQNPGRPVTNLGIGDVTLPLVPAVVDAMTKAVSEMGVADTFRGYCDEQGYLFLRQAVC